MNWKQKIKTLLRANAYYLAFGLCIAAVAVSGWLFVRSLSGADETPAQNDAVQAEAHRKARALRARKAEPSREDRAR